MSLGNGFKKTEAEEFLDSDAGKNSAIINFMTSSGEGAIENPFSQRDIDIVKQVKGMSGSKIKENDVTGYSAKMTNSHKKDDVSILKKQTWTILKKEKASTQMTINYIKKSSR